MGCPALTTYFASVEAQPKSADRRNDDGNMTSLPISSGTWACSWNAENRLIAMEKADKRLEFAYDYMGRRVEKKTYTGSSGNWTLVTHLRFVYDGYLQIEEIDAADSNALLKKRYWTGVEGYDRLISETHVTTGNTYYVMADANKNLTEYLTNAGAIAGHYEFSPFGQITRETGALSNEFDFRFSSESFEQETGLVYYNFRYYSPELGRWASRDPMEEFAGINIYVAVFNNITNDWDIHGYASGKSSKNSFEALFTSALTTSLTIIIDLICGEIVVVIVPKLGPAADNVEKAKNKHYKDMAKYSRHNHGVRMAVIEASNVADAKEQLKQYRCIKLLIITGHGNHNWQRIGLKGDESSDGLTSENIDEFMSEVNWAGGKGDVEYKACSTAGGKTGPGFIEDTARAVKGRAIGTAWPTHWPGARSGGDRVIKRGK